MADRRVSMWRRVPVLTAQRVHLILEAHFATGCAFGKDSVPNGERSDWFVDVAPAADFLWAVAIQPELVVSSRRLFRRSRSFPVEYFPE